MITERILSIERHLDDGNESHITTDLRLKIVEQLYNHLQKVDQDSFRPGQEAVMEDLIEFFSYHEKGYVSMPTGSGKTVLFSQILAATDARTLVLVPTKQLVTQTIEELAEWGVTDVRQAKNDLTLPQSERNNPPQVVVSTNAAFAKAAATPAGKYVINPEDFSLVIIDEAHHALAEGTSRALDQFDHAFQVGFTATPDYSELRQLKDRLPKVIHELTIRESVELGLITRYASVIATTNLDLSTVQTSKGDYNSVQLDKLINTDIQNNSIASFYADNLADKKAVFSCNSVDHSIAMAAKLRENGIKAAAVYGTMPDLEKTLTDFRNGELSVICNNKLLVEGFDDPTIEVIVNVSPTLSTVREQQRTGRGLRIDRANPDKELLIIDFLGNKQMRRPVVFSDEKIADGTGLSTVSAETQQILNKLGQYSSPTLRLHVRENSIRDQLETKITKELIHLPNSKMGENESSTLQVRDVITVKPVAKNTQPSKEVIKASPVSRVGKATVTHYVKQSDEASRGDIIKSLASLVVDEDDDKLQWQKQALCAQTDPETFFPERGGSTREAKRTCLTCDVRSECLDYALENQEQFGIWGGLSERERRKLRKRTVSRELA